VVAEASWRPWATCVRVHHGILLPPVPFSQQPHYRPVATVPGTGDLALTNLFLGQGLTEVHCGNDAHHPSPAAGWAPIRRSRDRGGRHDRNAQDPVARYWQAPSQRRRAVMVGPARPTKTETQRGYS